MRVLDPEDDLGDPGRDERLDARRRPALMRARLEGDDRDHPARVTACGADRGERRDLRVIFPRPPMEPLAADAAVGSGDDASDHGIWRRAAPAPLGQRERAVHERLQQRVVDQRPARTAKAANAPPS